MPEGPEIETEKLHEVVHEELEREGGAFLRSIALTTAILAVIAALAALQAGALAGLQLSPVVERRRQLAAERVDIFVRQ